MGFSPLATMCVNIGIQATLLFVRLRLTGKMIKMTYINFVKNVLAQVVVVTLVAMIIPLIICSILDNSFVSLVAVSIVSLICVCLSTYSLAMNKNERQYVLSAISKIAQKVKR